MKRVIVLFCAALLLWATICVAGAEDFTLHNGTTFGMTVDAVVEKEKAGGFDLQKSSYDDYLYSGTGTIANQADSTISYRFSENDSLVQMDYSFDSIETFSTVEQGLDKKYGTTDYSSATGLKYPYVTGSEWQSIPFDSFAAFTGNDYDVKIEANLTAYSHRLIDLADGQSMLIEHFTYSNTNYVYGKVSSESIGHKVRYRLLSEEETMIIKNATTPSDDL